MTRVRANYSSYLMLFVVGLIIVYPMFWLLMSSFKTSQEIFSGISIFPERLDLTAYVQGWAGNRQVGFATFFLNTFQLVIPTTLLSAASCLIVGYGFARFNFVFKKPLFYLMISTLMLPNAILIVPRFILFNNFGWLNTYYPWIVPAVFAENSFFIFLYIQFFRGIPRELDEASYIDGCSSWTILVRIMVPLSKPAIFSVFIFQFLNAWNDFFNQMIYLSSVTKYTVSLGLRMSMDITSEINWNEIMAMSVLTMIPPIALFFLAQKYFVEGISTTGLKG